MPTNTPRGYPRALGADNATTYVKTNLAAGLDLIDADVTALLAADASLLARSTANLLTNPGFEIWQRGTGPFTANGAYTADRWIIDLGGASTLSVSRNTADVDTGSRYCAALTYVHSSESGYRQDLEFDEEFRSRTLTLSVRVKASVATAVRVALWDNSGGGFTYSAYHSGGGAYETLTVTKAIGSAVTDVRAYLRLTASGTFHVDNATLVVGSTALAHVPLHPHEDLARCLRYYEIIGSGLAGEYFGIGQAYGAGSVFAHLRFTVRKATTPTVTASAAAHFSALTAGAGAFNAFTGISFGGITPEHVYLQCTGATGLVAGDASVIASANTAARIYLESNP